MHAMSPLELVAVLLLAAVLGALIGVGVAKLVRWLRL